MRLTALVLVALSPLNATADEEVRLKHTENGVTVAIGDAPFATFHHTRFAKPFFIDLRAPGGAIVTRRLEVAADDHPWHKGLWTAVDEVNGCKHWKEEQKIRTESVEIEASKRDSATIHITNTWLDASRKPLLDERTVIRVSADRLVSYDISLTPADKLVTFGDTKEGFFAIRLRDEMRAEGGSGMIVNAHGATGEEEAWGKTAPWVDYSGNLEGKPVGVAIFDHPDNFRPSRYHVRGYGLFAVSPFGEGAYTNGSSASKPITLNPGETLRLRYALFIHSGDSRSGDVAERYERYAVQK